MSAHPAGGGAARAWGRIPRATYRVQLGPAFSFRDVEAIVSYLDELGVSDLYASPILKTMKGSAHGYAICDHGTLSPELGGREGFDALTGALRERDMGLLLDTVPNHMSVAGGENAWWMDVLENGPSSRFASHFDIDWDSFKPELKRKVLLPVLEEQYGRVLEAGKLALACKDGAFFLHYYDTPLPVAPRTYALVLSRWIDRMALAPAGAGENADLQEARSILTALGYLPGQSESSPERLEEREREKEVIKRRIAALVASSARAWEALEEVLGDVNGIAGDPMSFNALDELVEGQGYRPAFWKVAGEEINYRRFFDINDLAAIRVELPVVFEETHRLIFELLAEGRITGLRIDHADGLWDPAGYLRALQERYEGLLPRANGGERPRCDHPLYVVVEKILSADERLRDDWTVHGTTGYDFLNDVNGIFVETGRVVDFDRLYSRFIGGWSEFADLSRANRRLIMQLALAGEIQSLGHALDAIAERNRNFRDFTLGGLTLAIRETVASLPVYRTYIDAPTGVVSAVDRAIIEAAIEVADAKNPRIARSLFDFVRDTLLLRTLALFRQEDRPRLIEFVMKFQQITGPVMAKGVEDTTFYVFNRLLSLNEVGGAPERFGTPLARFHERNVERRRRWPHTMLATATHDTKRGEDVRARLDVLSEMPEEWDGALQRWTRLNEPLKRLADGRLAPDRNDEYFYYQTLVGAMPEGEGDVPPETIASFRDRVTACMLKAAKESKVHTSWVNPDEEYDRVIHEFVERTLSPEHPFLGDLIPFARRVRHFGRMNSLSQALLKLAAPGVPDFYQGTELWDLSLVDPDNRRPVDFAHRRAVLAALGGRIRGARGDLRALAGELLASMHDGRVKMFLIHRALGLRRERPALFAEGDYRPLEAEGEKAAHVCAFARVACGAAMIAVCPRLVVGLLGGEETLPMGAGVWGGTRLAPGALPGRTFINVFTGERVETKNPGGGSIPLAEVLETFPVALLASAR